MVWHILNVVFFDGFFGFTNIVNACMHSTRCPNENKDLSVVLKTQLTSQENKVKSLGETETTFALTRVSLLFLFSNSLKKATTMNVYCVQ